MNVQIAAIVEGHGEVEAVPILIRRIALTIDPGFVPKVLLPIRIHGHKLRKEGEIERAVILAGRKLGGKGGIVVITDCDWKNGCPAVEGPSLLSRAVIARSDMPLCVVMAKKEFEAWFLAAAESLRGRRGLPADLNPPDDPENIRGAKEWLSRKMPPGSCYSASTDQPAFTKLFDLHAARKADSFDKCYRDIRRILEQLRLGAGL